MIEEIVLVSNDFNTTGPYVQQVIDDFGYRTNDVAVGNQELIPINDPSIDENWELITKKGTADEKRDFLYSVIHVWQDEEHFSPTHIRIVCSKKKILVDYLTQLAILLWQKCNPDQPEISGHPPVKPYFRSLADYLMAKLEMKESKSRTGINRFNRWRKERALLFKEVKEKDPILTQAGVASRATDVAKTRIRTKIERENPTMRYDIIEKKVAENFREQYNNHKDKFEEEDVSNDYRDTGWKWEKGDRLN